MRTSDGSRFINGNVVLWHYVEDLPRAVDWYSEVLEMKPTSNIDVASFFSINESTKLALSNRFQANEQNNLPKSAMLDLQSDDIFEAHRMLKSKGVEVEEMNNPILNYHEFYFKDMENNQIRIHGFVQE